MWAHSAILSLVKLIPHWWDNSKLETVQMKKPQGCPWPAHHRPNSELLTSGAGWTCSKCIWHNCKSRDFIYSLRSAKILKKWFFLRALSQHFTCMSYNILSVSFNPNSHTVVPKLQLYQYYKVSTNKSWQWYTPGYPGFGSSCTKTMPSSALKAPMCSWLYKNYT